jgi:hypothetical protein
VRLLEERTGLQRVEVGLGDGPERDALTRFARHRLVVESMGRPAAADPARFQAATAAGALAARTRP